MVKMAALPKFRDHICKYIFALLAWEKLREVREFYLLERGDPEKYSIRTVLTLKICKLDIHILVLTVSQML